MTDVIQTIELPDGTLQDVQVPEEWTPEQINTAIMAEIDAGNIVLNDVPKNVQEPTPTPAARPTDSPGVAKQVAFGFAKTPSVIGALSNVIEQKVFSREPSSQEVTSTITEVPGFAADTPADIVFPEEAVTREVTTTLVDPGLSERQIAAQQKAELDRALRGMFPDLIGTAEADSTAVKVGEGIRLVTDLITMPLPFGKQKIVAQLAIKGEKIIGSVAGRRALGNAALESGTSIALFGAADNAIRQQAAKGEIDPEEVGIAGLISGAGGALIGPILAAGGGRFVRWVKTKMDDGSKVTVEDVMREATGSGATPDKVSYTGDEVLALVKAIEDVQANAKVEAGTIDTIAGITKPATKGQKAARQKELNAAFKEDAAMADFLKRESAPPVTPKQDTEELAQFPVVVARARRAARQQVANEIEKRKASGQIPPSIDEVQLARLKADQESRLAAVQAKQAEASKEALEAKTIAEKATVEAEQATTSGLRIISDPNTPRNKQGNIAAGFKFGQAVIDRIEQIAPRLAFAVRRSSQRAATRTTARIRRIDKFFQSPEYKGLTRADKESLTGAALNGDAVTRDAILAKVDGLADLYNINVRKQLDGIQAIRNKRRERMSKKDRDRQGFIENFHPRVVKNVRKLRKSLGREDQGKLNDALASAAREKGRPLSEDEVAGLLNQATGGRTLRQDRSRRIKEIPPSQLKNYFSDRDALIDYFHRVESDEATDNFFRGTLGTEELNFTVGAGPEKIGKLLSRALQSGDVRPRDMEELVKLIDAQFGLSRAGVGEGQRVFRNLFTAGTLGFNPFSTLTQIQDIAPVMAKFGVKNTLQSLFGRKIADVYDIGVRELAKETRTQKGTAQLVRNGLKIFGFDKLDKIGGNTAVNAGLRKWFSRADKSPTTALKELTRLLGPEDAQNVVTALRGRVITDDVKTLILHEVAGIRPVAREDMPLNWATQPGGRWKYSLLSWTLKQLNFVRNTALKDIRNGKVIVGTKKLLTFGLLMGLVGTPVVAIKDFMRGKEFEPGDAFVQSSLALGMSGKYVADALQRGSGVEALGAIVPVIGISGNATQKLFKGVVDGDLEALADISPTSRSLKNIATSDFIPALVGGAITGGGMVIDAIRDQVQPSEIPRRELTPDDIEGIKNQLVVTNAQFGLPDGLLFNIAQAESSFRPEIISGQTVSKAGALGLMQFMPSTAEQFKINPLVPGEAIVGAAKYMQSLIRMFDGDVTKAVAGYNWGPGNVRRKGLNAAPKETRDYVKKVLGVTI